MGLVRKVISPIRKMAFTPQRSEEHITHTHTEDNMNMNIHMGSSTHTPMMMSSCSENIAHQHSHQKQHSKRETPYRNDYIVAEHKSVV